MTHVAFLHSVYGLRPAVQLHVGDGDTMFPPDEVAAWQEAMTAAGAAVEVFSYSGAGHFFTDPGEAAAALTWERSLRFVGAR